MGAGGKREGAGRKKTNNYETAVVRIPLFLKDKVTDLVKNELSNFNQNDLCNNNQISNDSSNDNKLVKIQEIIDKYENESLCNLSPRWQHAKRLIADLKQAIDTKE